MNKSNEYTDPTIAAESFKQRLAKLGIDSSTLAYEQLACIGARINGEWDNIYLVEFGALLSDTDEDIKRIAATYKHIPGK